MKRLHVALGLTLALIVAGCSSGTGTDANTSGPSSQVATGGGGADQSSVSPGSIASSEAAPSESAQSSAASDSSAATSGTVTITDMLGRKVTMPRTINRILALHPIPTGLLAIMAPQKQVSIDMVFQKSLANNQPQYTPEEYQRLSGLPVTGVYFKGLSTEQILELHPDVVITMVGDPNIDKEQQQTGIPFFAVSKAPTSSYETTIRLVGQIIGQQQRADELADFWAKTVDGVVARTAQLPDADRPTVMYTGQNGDILGTPGKNTVFGSTIDTAGGKNVGDQLPTADAATESNTVTIEQIIKWNPDIIIASGAATKAKIMSDPQWKTLKAVQSKHVYAPRAFAGLDGLQAVLGMVWVQGIVADGDSAAAEQHLTDVVQSYYTLFYGHPLTDEQIAQEAK